jgi:PAS domain S-box-containing protein
MSIQTNPFLIGLVAFVLVAGMGYYAYAIFRHQLLDLVPVARDTVVESMRDGYVVVDSDGRVVDLNDAAAAVAARDDALGERAGEVFPECAALLAEHEHGTQTETEFTVEDAGGQRFLIATVSSLRKDDRLIGRLLFIRDVTDRRSVQKRYQALIENSSDLIFVMEPDGTLTYASPSLRNVTGADPQQVQGEDAFAFIHPDDRERVQEAFDAVQTEPGRQKRVEYRIVTAEDEWINVEAELSNLLENPYVEGIVSNARDITARKERERELKELNERLVAANERLERFASVVSHDLRNPINVARGHLEMAREAGKEENFEKVEDSLERMEAIINDVLTLARQGESVGETDSVGLGAVARDAWETVETGEARLDVVDDADFEADPDRLRQLLENVFRNAVEHGSTSPDSQARQDAVEHCGPDVTVRVGWSGDGFYVADDGPGIPEDRREDVFEAGTTTNSDGTGLGLSIVEEIATAHGWEVAATESAEGGARFEFRGVATLEAAD